MHPILAKIAELETLIANSPDAPPEHVREAHRLLDLLRISFKHLPHAVGDMPEMIVVEV